MEEEPAKEQLVTGVPEAFREKERKQKTFRCFRGDGNVLKLDFADSGTTVN